MPKPFTLIAKHSLREEFRAAKELILTKFKLDPNQQVNQRKKLVLSIRSKCPFLLTQFLLLYSVSEIDV
jgi:hypothetical protein